ncbi:hypothetical protein O0I10_010000 [Lichtheimia ornata]|uniref:Uncharacterized protein n=1 Tax=Lichtheimia ornata TaxID=688661 RepID=A0AAD7XRQ0_9FUNG|nr:uncharacterized protein O0I10_010000 [Lichtheimia ornata]KAJ8654304.1 hypothetical protein O0I10_010000 [Lichtheimia ornata]
MHTADAVPVRGTHSRANNRGKVQDDHVTTLPGTGMTSTNNKQQSMSDQATHHHAMADASTAQDAFGRASSSGATSGSGTSSNGGAASGSGATSGSGTTTGSHKPSRRETKSF